MPGGRLGSGAKTAPAPMHCQEDVEAILKARTIRFGEASAAIDPAVVRSLARDGLVEVQDGLVALPGASA